MMQKVYLIQNSWFGDRQNKLQAQFCALFKKIVVVHHRLDRILKREQGILVFVLISFYSMAWGFKHFSSIT